MATSYPQPALYEYRVAEFSWNDAMVYQAQYSTNNGSTWFPTGGQTHDSYIGACNEIMNIILAEASFATGGASAKTPTITYLVYPPF